MALAALIATAAPSQATTASPSPTGTASPAPTTTSTADPSPTASATATDSPTGTATPTPTPTSTATPTGSPTSSHTTPPALTPIQAKYAALGGTAGWLGAATTAEDCTTPPGDGCTETFQHGAIYWTAATSAQPVAGGIGARWAATGGAAGFLGYPTSDEVPIRNGVYQLYEGGAIYWSPATGAHTSHGGIRAEFGAKDWENGFLGYPTSDEVPARNGGVYQLYQGGAILWSPATGAHTSGGAVRDAWAATGYEGGPLGYPTTDEVPIRNGGVYQLYQGGAIYWSSGTGAHTSAGGIRAAYAGTGWENGSLGYPITNEACSGSACIQKFQGGTITWIAGITGVHGYNECEWLNNGHSNYPSYGASTVSFAVAESYGSYSAWFIRCQNTAGVYWPDWYTPATVGRSGFKPPGVASGPTRYEYSPRATTPSRRRSASATPGPPCRTRPSTRTRAGAATPAPRSTTSTSRSPRGSGTTRTCGTSPPGPPTTTGRALF
ncbi:LGFP repeat-containing protein [Sinomonas atrocyanea]